MLSFSPVHRDATSDTGRGAGVPPDQVPALKLREIRPSRGQFVQAAYGQVRRESTPDHRRGREEPNSDDQLLDHGRLAGHAPNLEYHGLRQHLSDTIAV